MECTPELGQSKFNLWGAFSTSKYSDEHKVSGVKAYLAGESGAFNAAKMARKSDGFTVEKLTQEFGKPTVFLGGLGS